jgi:hypothetical protein
MARWSKLPTTSGDIRNDEVSVNGLVAGGDGGEKKGKERARHNIQEIGIQRSFPPKRVIKPYKKMRSTLRACAIFDLQVRSAKANAFLLQRQF